MITKKLAEEIDKDLIIDRTNLTQESLRTPEIHQKYLYIYYNEKDILRTLEINYIKKKKEKREYYSGKSDPEIYKKNPFGLRLNSIEVRQYMDEDDELLEYNKLINEKKDILELLDRTITQISNRSYHITNMIKWEKHINGE